MSKWEKEIDNLDRMLNIENRTQEYVANYYNVKWKHILKQIRKYKIPYNINRDNGKTYICKYCGKVFHNRCTYIGHISACKQSPKYKEREKQLAEARTHINKNKNNVHGEFICQYCGKILPTLNGLKHHEPYCKSNPNRKVHHDIDSYREKIKGHPAWNNGKTMLTDKRILNGREARKEYYKAHDNISIKHTEETKRVLREKMIEYIEENCGKIKPIFSKKACEYIDNLNVQYGWNLKHALNNENGEYQVCGYFLDGYDPELNIAFEYDEPKHYKDKLNNILCERDLIRQKQIIKELKCKFYRYNEYLNKFYLVE